MTKTQPARLSEFGLIEKIRKRWQKKLPAGTYGIGDDCAVIPLNQERALLVTTDLLADGVHFLSSKIPADQLGYKSLAVNISDIAAMGGTPKFAFLSLALPRTTTPDWSDAFLSGFERLANKNQILFLGGDTTASTSGIVINVCLIGEAELKKTKYRSTARPGDVICVTDYLGDSAAGLFHVLKNQTAGNEKDTRYLLQRHYCPPPNLAHGQFLAARPEVNAMMDLSDGLASDLERICESSSCGAEIDLEKLPLSSALKRFCTIHKYDSRRIAFSGGEEYCLLLTVNRLKYSELRAAFRRRFKRDLTAIGTITKSPSKVTCRFGNTVVESPGSAFSHFE